MLEHGKITPYQLFCMMSAFLAGSSIIMQSLTVAGRDTWLSGWLAILAGGVMILVTTALARQFPGLTLVEYAQVLLGKVPGKVIGALYLWFFLHLGALVLRNYGEFMAALVLVETPMWFFHLLLALAVAFLVYRGLEVMGRLSEVIFAVGIFFFTIIMILLGLSGKADLHRLLPVLEKGWAPIIKGALPLASFPYWELILFTMVFPRVNIPSRTRAFALEALFFLGLILQGLLVMGLAVSGEALAGRSFPGYDIFRLISVGGFIERIDPLVIAEFVMGGLVKIGVCLYGFVLGLALLLRLKTYRPLVVPSAVLMVVLSLLVYDNTLQMLDFAVNVFPVYALPVQVVLPLVMLGVTALRNRWGRAGGFGQQKVGEAGDNVGKG